MMRGNGEGRPVVALDIDGTLGDYHRHFLEFAALWFDKPMPGPEEFNPGLRLHRFMGVKLSDYRTAKLAYRQGGWKRWMPVYPGAAELTRAIRKAGAEVWICTTRPYLRLDNIDPDTREWLRRAKIQYDAVLFGEDKYRELYRQAGGRIAAVLEDLPEQWYAACEMIVRPTSIFNTRGHIPGVFLRDQPYNKHVDTGERVMNLEEARPLILEDVNMWKITEKGRK